MTPEAIFWDFDGVLMDSNSVRDFGFEQTLSAFPQEEVSQLMTFHKANGGLSRYVKFRYFFEQVRGEVITEDGIKAWAEKFSAVVKGLLVDPSLLIQETLGFVTRKHTLIPMHIVSGSDQSELRHVCGALKIDQYFKSIHGSPTPKSILVADLLTENKYRPDQCVLIGDSINDFEAALNSKMQFMAYNNSALAHLTTMNIAFL